MRPGIRYAPLSGLALSLLAGPVLAAPAAGEPVGAPRSTFGTRPALAMDPLGGFVMVREVQDDFFPTTGVGINVERYSASALYETGTRASTTVPNSQESAQVAMAPDGRFVVVWNSNQQDGDGGGIYGQRFAATGTTAVGGEFRINATVAGSQTDPAVGMTADGSFVVAWSSTSGASLQAQRFAADGTLLGAEIRVDDPAATGQEAFPAITVGSAGFVIAWSDPATGVMARQFLADGSPVAAAFQVSSTAGSATDRAFRPAVASAADGSFVVAWSDGNIHARRYSASAVASAAAFQVNTDTSKTAVDAAIAVNRDGAFTVAWGTRESGGAYADVKLRRFDAAGEALAGEQLVGSGREPRLASDADGDITVAWSQPEGTFVGIVYGTTYAQRYSGPEPVDLALAVTHTAAGTTCDPVSYTTTITNQHAVTGEAGVGAASHVSFTLETPTDMDLVAEDPAVLDEWICGRTEGYTTCTLIDALPPGESRSVTLPFLGPRAPGSANATVAASGGQVDPDADDNVVQNPVTFTQGAGSGTLTVAATSLSVTEGNTVQLTLTRSGESNCSGYVDLEYVGGSALAGADYTEVIERVDWRDGETGSRSFTIHTVEDNTDEDDEAFALSLVPTGLPLNVTSIPVTIVEDDEAGLVLVVPAAEPQLTEGTAPVAYQVRLTTRPTAAVTVTLSTNNNRLGVNPTTLTFTPENSQILQTVTVSNVNDSAQQADQLVNISHAVSSSDTKYNGGLVVAQVTLIDDDGGHVVATEGGGGGAVGSGTALVLLLGWLGGLRRRLDLSQRELRR